MTGPVFDRMRDHWWWRPGWRFGRSYYTWHLTFDDAQDAHRLAGEYADSLALPGLDVIPPRWLHLTVQGVGFTDEVDPSDVEAIAEAVRRRLSGTRAFEVVLGPTVIGPEGVALRVTPPGPVAALRAGIRAGIADVWGPGGVPGSEGGFEPHVSLAYSSSDGPAEPIVQAAESVEVAPARTTVREARLIVLDRDHREYRWTAYATAPLA